VRGAGLAALAGMALVIAGCAAVLRRRIAIVAIVGPSMEPALAEGDRVLVRRAGIDDVRTGQVVVLEKPDMDGSWRTEPPRWLADRREWLIKRVAALPGEQLPEGVLPGSTRPGVPVVPAGSLVVLGDNAASSFDSRRMGLIPAERLLGVMLRPMSRHAG
jgi:signal peptidase I